MTDRLALERGAFDPCRAIGVTLDEELVCGVVWHDFRWPDIRASLASTTPRWLTRRVLRGLFAYPFIQLKCNRVTAVVRGSDTTIQAFDERLGFKREGTLRRAWHDGQDDAILLGMLREECPWV